MRRSKKKQLDRGQTITTQKPMPTNQAQRVTCYMPGVMEYGIQWKYGHYTSHDIVDRINSTSLMYVAAVIDDKSFWTYMPALGVTAYEVQLWDGGLRTSIPHTATVPKSIQEQLPRFLANPNTLKTEPNSQTNLLPFLVKSTY